mmetsp:Transcript_55329/g.145675  ORF Transcript_55329/g.145675 Transcript_55329/m.145675 type:complete len:249 (-) Transcript_55329:253-999(-)
MSAAKSSQAAFFSFSGTSWRSSWWARSGVDLPGLRSISEMSRIRACPEMSVSSLSLLRARTVSWASSSFRFPFSSSPSTTKRNMLSSSESSSSTSRSLSSRSLSSESSSLSAILVTWLMMDCGRCRVTRPPPRWSATGSEGLTWRWMSNHFLPIFLYMFVTQYVSLLPFEVTFSAQLTTAVNPRTCTFTSSTLILDPLRLLSLNSCSQDFFTSRKPTLHFSKGWMHLTYAASSQSASMRLMSLLRNAS